MSRTSSFERATARKARAVPAAPLPSARGKAAPAAVAEEEAALAEEAEALAEEEAALAEAAEAALVQAATAEAAHSRAAAGGATQSWAYAAAEGDAAPSAAGVAGVGGRLAWVSESEEEEEEDEEEDERWACFQDGMTSPSVPVIAVGMEALISPPTDVQPAGGATYGGGADETFAPRMERLGGEAGMLASLAAAHAADITPSAHRRHAIMTTAADTAAVAPAAAADGGSPAAGASPRAALRPCKSSFGNAPGDSAASGGAPSGKPKLERAVGEAGGEVEGGASELLSPGARLDAARREDESSRDRAARLWRAELHRAEMRASLPMSALLRAEGEDEGEAEGEAEVDEVAKAEAEAEAEAELEADLEAELEAEAESEAEAEAEAEAEVGAGLLAEEDCDAGRSVLAATTPVGGPRASWGRRPSGDGASWTAGCSSVSSAAGLVLEDNVEGVEEAGGSSGRWEWARGGDDDESAYDLASSNDEEPFDLCERDVLDSPMPASNSMRAVHVPRSPGTPAASPPLPAAAPSPAPAPARGSALAAFGQARPRFAATAGQPATKRTPPWRVAAREARERVAVAPAVAQGEAGLETTVGKACIAPAPSSALTDLLQAAELGASSPMPDILKGLSKRLRAQHSS